MQDVFTTLTGKEKKDETFLFSGAGVCYPGAHGRTQSHHIRLGQSPAQGFDRMSRLEEKIDALILDDATRTALHKAIDEGRVAQDDMRSQLRKARRDLRALLQQDIRMKPRYWHSPRPSAGSKLNHRKQELHTLLTCGGHAHIRATRQPQGDYQPHGTRPGQER